MPFITTKSGERFNVRQIVLYFRPPQESGSRLLIRGTDGDGFYFDIDESPEQLDALIRDAVRAQAEMISLVRLEAMDSHDFPDGAPEGRLPQAGVSTPDRQVRDEIAWFAQQMEERLAAHDPERGDEWRGMEPHQLLRRLTDELSELEGEVPAGPKVPFGPGIIREAADVANFCMMLADMGRRPAGAPEGRSSQAGVSTPDPSPDAAPGGDA